MDRLDPKIKHTEEDARERNITEKDLIQAEMNRKKDNTEDVSREEIIARACEDLLKMSEQGRKIFSSLSEGEQKTLFEKVKAIITDLMNWVNDLLNSYESTSTEARIMREYKEQLQKASKVWDKMLEDSVKVNQALEKSGAFEHNSTNSSELFSVKNVDGKNVVWVEDSLFTNKQLLKYSVVEKYIREHIGEVYTIIESGQKVYLGDDLPSEYIHSKYTKNVLQKNPNIIRAKRRVSANLGEMIEIATNRRWEKTKHRKAKDAKYGMYRYDTKFGFPIKDASGKVVSANIFNAEILIYNASDGKKYLYDVVGIKKDTTSSEWLTKKLTSAAENSTGQKGNASKDIILNSDKNVNTKFSNKDAEYLELFEVSS